MRNIIQAIGLFCFFSIAHKADAQVKFYEDSLFNRYAASDQSKDKFRSSSYYITIWNEEIPVHINLTRRLSDHVAIISSAELEFAQKHSFFKMSIANDDWKLSPDAERSLQKKNFNQQKIIVASKDVHQLIAILKKDFSHLHIHQVDSASQSVVVQYDKDVLKNLLALPVIIFADIFHQPHTEIGIIGYDRSFHGINALTYNLPDANGKNIVVGVKEQRMEAADLDLYKRVLLSPLQAGAIENHATVISSIIGGAGNSFYDGHGIASGCLFFPSSFVNLFADDSSTLKAAKVTVQNHSYGTIIQQFYGAEALSYDAQAWSDKQILHIFSAGNKGAEAPTEGVYAGLKGSANLTGNFKMAKNIVTVAAVDNKGMVAPESSAGPLFDGRLAPQLTALGPNGTSDAAAIISGTAAVLQQVYADSNHGMIPPAALVKALLYTTADDIFTPGIDYKTGFGLVNSYEAVKKLQEKKYFNASINQGQIWTHAIEVPPNMAQLKVTLAWTDTAASLNVHRALINDLDMELVESNTGIVYKPWVLSTVANKDSLGRIAIRKRDSLNTFEQVSIALPASGNYQIRISSAALSATAIPFSIAYSLDTLHAFHFTSPQHASDINRQENSELSIRWKTRLIDTTETGDLYISYDNRITWQLIGSAYKLYKQQYRWPISDTASIGAFKMQTSFGDFFSKDFVISKTIRPQVDFVCADSFGLSWQRHIYAAAYRVYSLVDSPYLKIIATVADTAVVFNRSKYPSLVYAVEPVLSNHLPAVRSIAFNIELQGVQCFYRALNYTLLGDNRMSLQLELSTPGYADSVFFECVSVGGQWIQTWGGAKVNSSQFYYTQVVDELLSGTTYIRGRIRLKSGATVYTDIIPVLSSGAQLIVFYPNPASRQEPLRYILRQGVPPDSRLQVYDLWGRLIRNYSSLPVSIDVSGLVSGVYVFKLSNENAVLEVVKVVIP